LKLKTFYGTDSAYFHTWLRKNWKRFKEEKEVENRNVRQLGDGGVCQGKLKNV
jgi:hypothetical protein